MTFMIFFSERKFKFIYEILANPTSKDALMTHMQQLTFPILNHCLERQHGQISYCCPNN